MRQAPTIVFGGIISDGQPQRAETIADVSIEHIVAIIIRGIAVDSNTISVVLATVNIFPKVAMGAIRGHDLEV